MKSSLSSNLFLTRSSAFKQKRLLFHGYLVKVSRYRSTAGRNVGFFYKLNDVADDGSLPGTAVRFKCCIFPQPHYFIHYFFLCMKQQSVHLHLPVFFLSSGTFFQEVLCSKQYVQALGRIYPSTASGTLELVLVNTSLF